MLKEFFQFEKIEVVNADRLYPTGISWPLRPGTNVVAGGTGLGKTTLIHIALFTAFGRVGGSSRALQTVDAAYFTGRLTREEADSSATSVADAHESEEFEAEGTGASEANESDAPYGRVHLSIGDAKVVVGRNLRNGRLKDAAVNGKAVPLDEYTSVVAKRLGLDSFEAEVLRLVDCLIYLPENPTYYLAWDSLSQNEVLSILFGDPDDFKNVHAIWEELSSADSQFRNLRFQAQRVQKEILAAAGGSDSQSPEAVAAQREGLEEARKRAEAQLLEVASRVAATQSELDTAASRYADLQSRYLQLSAELSASDSSDQDSQLADILFAAPQAAAVSDALARLLASPRTVNCPCCAQVPGAENVQLRRVRKAIESRECPVCSTPFAVQPPKRVRSATAKVTESISSVGEALRSALTEHEQAASRLRVLQQERDRHDVAVRAARDAEWSYKLEHPVAGTSQATITLEGLKASEAKAQALRNRLVTKFETARDALNEKLRKLRAELAKAFQRHCSQFLDESVEIYFDEKGERADRRGPQIDPMHSAFYPIIDGTPRYRAETLSAAQRVFVDLAFRMALLSVWGQRKKRGVTLIVETPEGSVDTAYMIRVAEMLRSFAAEHQIVVTTNINNETFLPQLLSKTNPAERKARILNMLEVGIPKGVQQKHRQEFDKVLKLAVKGVK